MPQASLIGKLGWGRHSCLALVFLSTLLRFSYICSCQLQLTSCVNRAGPHGHESIRDAPSFGVAVSAVAWALEFAEVYCARPFPYLTLALIADFLVADAVSKPSDNCWYSKKHLPLERAWPHAFLTCPASIGSVQLKRLHAQQLPPFQGALPGRASAFHFATPFQSAFTKLIFCIRHLDRGRDRLVTYHSSRAAKQPHLDKLLPPLP